MANAVDAATATMIANYEKNTGKPLEAWVALARKEKLSKHGEIVKWLKEKHAMGHGYANLVAQRTLAGDAPEPAADDLLAGQYAGAKAALRPAYDKLAGEIAKFGADVEFSPKKAYVSLRRKKQFGLVQPSTADRLDIGINLKGVAAKGRLEASGSFNAMVSHRVRVAKAADIDGELIGWLRAAYDQA
ncbi:MAG: DUF4287 domain-containing protein [Betaproteobacteria bacterium]|nr:DUF4287 domain-containing protein [Betaproteobacteria bacterium]